LFDPLRPARRFPPPWSVEEQAACFVVRDHNGQQLVSGKLVATRLDRSVPSAVGSRSTDNRLDE